jgi:hypothetical protein
MSITALKKNEQINKIKLQFEELQKDLDDLICKEHTKVKTIYIENFPSKSGKGGFICEYCPNPTKVLKFYSNIIEENAGLIKKINNSNISDSKNILTDEELLKFSDLSYNLDQRNIEFNQTLKNFDETFTPELIAKTYGDEELIKLKEIIKTISFNQNGKPIYENIGQNKQREIQYLKLAHILVALKDYKFNSNSNYTNDLYRHIEQIILLRDNFVIHINEYMRFITGDFYYKIHEIDNVPLDVDFLNNKKLFIQEDERYLIEFQKKLAQKDNDIDRLNEIIRSFTAENESLNKQNVLNKSTIETLNRKNDDLKNEIKRLEEIINNLNKALNETCVESSNSEEEFNNRLNLLTTEFEKRILPLQKEMDELRKKNKSLENERNYIIENNSIENKRLNSELEEALLSRENLAENYSTEKNSWIKYRNELLEEIGKLKKLSLNVNKLENDNKDLNKKIELINKNLEYLTKRNEELERLNSKFNSEKDELLLRIENYILENNSLINTLKNYNDDSKKSNFYSELNNDLLNDLKKQVAINKTLNVEIENLQEKINAYNNRLSTNELLIKNQLELIRKYHEERPTLNYDKKSDMIESNKKQTESIIKKIEQMERNPLNKSLYLNIEDNGVESYIRNTITNSNPNENLSKSQILMSENYATSGNKYILPAFKPTKVVYKINFSNDLLLNNSNWEMIRDWIDETNIFSTGIQPKLIHKSTRDGFSAKNFQKNCHNYQNVLIIAKTDHNKIIGGFSPLPWILSDQSDRYLRDLTNSTFLYSVNEREKYLIKKNCDAICITTNQGPIFGDNDFVILDNCNVNENHKNNFGSSFNTNLSAKEFFGNERYLIKEYEAYQIL